MDSGKAFEKIRLPTKAVRKCLRAVRVKRAKTEKHRRTDE
jgi:hypothetical protein